MVSGEKSGVKKCTHYLSKLLTRHTSAWTIPAWGGECRGSVEGPPTGEYACGDDEGRARVFAKCADWPFAYRGAMESECGKGLRLASAEFSASTHQYVRSP
jgi:hypothetical protein